jgi:hypothetical protein
MNSLYNLGKEQMKKWVIQEEEELIEQAELLRLPQQKVEEGETSKESW